MVRLVGTTTLLVGGFLLARTAGIGDIATSGMYRDLVVIVLAIGLYVSTAAIDLGEARHHQRTIVEAVTAGVGIKATVIGAVAALAFGSPRYFLLGVVMAQIDPLSVAATLRDSRMSGRAKTILAAWASFDDPVTVMLVVAVTALGTAPHTGSHIPPGAGAPPALDHVLVLILNGVFAAATFVIWLSARRSVAMCRALLALVFLVAITQELLLGLALAGLFLRPQVAPFMHRVTRVAVGILGLMLGMLLTGGANIGGAMVLGCATFLAQAMVAVPITRQLPAVDRLLLAVAQQNGVTSISLGLLLEPIHPGTIGLVAPAVVIVALLHATADGVVHRKGPSHSIHSMEPRSHRTLSGAPKRPPHE